MARNQKGLVTGEPVTYQIPAPAGGVQLETFIPWTLVKRGVRRQVITPIDAPEQFQEDAIKERLQRKHAQDSAVTRALGLAHYWQRLVDGGKYRSLTEIAADEGIDLGRASRTAQLTRLAPEVIQSCLSAGRSAPKLDELVRICIVRSWADQSAQISNGSRGRQ